MDSYISTLVFFTIELIDSAVRPNKSNDRIIDWVVTEL